MQDLLSPNAEITGEAPRLYTWAFRFDGDRTSSGEASLDIQWEAKVSLAVPGTLTVSEVRQHLQQMLPEMLRSRCHLIIQQLHDDVVASVLTQLEEVAEYEERMWRVRRLEDTRRITERGETVKLKSPGGQSLQETFGE